MFVRFYFLSLSAPKAGYSQGATQYTQAQQTRQVTAIKPATPSPATTTFSIYPVSSTVQPVAAAATVVPSYTQSATYSTTAVTYSGKNFVYCVAGISAVVTGEALNTQNFSSLFSVHHSLLVSINQFDHYNGEVFCCIFRRGLMFVYAYFVTCENMQSIGVLCVAFCDLL